MFKKYMYLSILVAQLACGTLNSQENVHTQYNSLKETLKKASKATDSLDAMVALAYYLQDNNIDTAGYYTKQVLKLFQRDPSKRSLSKVQLLSIKQQILTYSLDTIPKELIDIKRNSTLRKGSILYLETIALEALYNTSRDKHKETVELIEGVLFQYKGTETAQIANLYVHLSEAYLATKNISSAIKWGQKAVVSYKILQHKKGLNAAYRSLSLAYTVLFNFDKATEYIENAKKSIGNLGSNRSRALDALCLGVIYAKNKNYNKALPIFTNVLALNKKVKDKYIEQRALYYWFAVQLENKNYKAVLAKAATYPKKIADLRLSYVLNFNLVRAYLVAGDNIKASQYLKNIDKILATNKFDAVGKEAIQYYLLAAYLESEIGNYKRAFFYANTYIGALRKYNEALNLEKVIENETKFKVQEKELALKDALIKTKDASLKLVKAAKERNFYLVMILFVVLAFMFVLLLLKHLSKRNKELKNNNNILFENKKLLVHSNKAIKKTFSIISHDLRAPFNSILGLFQFLNAEIDNLPKEEIKKSLKHIEKAAKNNFNLTQKLLIWSVAQHKGLVVIKKPYNIAETIRQVIEINGYLLHEKNLQLVHNGSNTQFKYDEQLIRNILNNLIGNAIKYSNPSTIIQISTVVKHHKLYITVKDQGQGMARETLKKINTNYNEEDGVLMSFKNGNVSGYGIALSKELIALHKGTLIFESIEGKGTTAIIEVIG
jgi:signal transduction histidine kinase/tetratricopeptide (TPR) repeat protein